MIYDGCRIVLKVPNSTLLWCCDDPKELLQYRSYCRSVVWAAIVFPVWGLITHPLQHVFRVGSQMESPFNPNSSARHSSETLGQPETVTGLVETFTPSDPVTNAGHIQYSDRAKLHFFLLTSFLLFVHTHIHSRHGDCLVFKRVELD